MISTKFCLSSHFSLFYIFTFLILFQTAGILMSPISRDPRDLHPALMWTIKWRPEDANSDPKKVSEKFGFIASILPAYSCSGTILFLILGGHIQAGKVLANKFWKKKSKMTFRQISCLTISFKICYSLVPYLSVFSIECSKTLHRHRTHRSE